jgi:sterol desaturase/sphingolipid hydroxylase (fatty acid hydroxylase superfamily)
VQHLPAIIHNCWSSVSKGAIVISIGFIVFTFMERLFSFSTAKKPWRATLLDLQYAFISMLYPPFIYFILSAIFGFLSLNPGASARDSQVPFAVLAVQLAALLFVRDCLIYLRHRIFHTRPVWAFHSIHHSSEEVDWLSAARFHPAENMIEATGEILLFLAAKLVGLDPGVLSVGALVIGFYNFFIHSNLRWTFGPLRYVLVSPVFHRWHHSDKEGARDKNFAAMFSCLDLLCGTFYMPKDSMPVTLGLSPEEKAVHPRTLGRQLLYPFRKR